MSNRTLVYQAVREKDQQPASVKVLRRLYPTFNEFYLSFATNMRSPVI